MLTSLNEHDVILGRGTGPNNYIGNQNFRNLIDEYRKEYVDAGDTVSDVKSRIASTIFQKIQTRGGRFVKQLKKGRLEGNVYVEGRWQVAQESVALEKIKQVSNSNNAVRSNCKRPNYHVYILMTFSTSLIGTERKAVDRRYEEEEGAGKGW